MLVKLLFKDDSLSSFFIVAFMLKSISTCGIKTLPDFPREPEKILVDEDIYVLYKAT